MSSLREEIKEELSTLIKEGRSFIDFQTKPPKPSNQVFSKYQGWYSCALAAIRQLVPDRLEEFVNLYKTDPKARNLSITALQYGIDLYLLGTRITMTKGYSNEQEDSFDHEMVIVMRIQQQIQILSSAETRFESILSNIRGLVQADLFDSQLEAARELCKHGHLRAAGTMAGVVLEAHLAEVSRTRGVPIKKKDPTIADLDDALKGADVIDIPVWRGLQRLGDLRNYCAHKKDREPTREEVVELIDGVEKICKTLV